MDKFAQQRSFRSKVWETVNLTGKAMEGLHSEFGDIMEDMREVDANIRDIAADVKPLVRQAKSALRQRDYLTAAAFVSEFHQKVRHIDHILNKFRARADIKHYKYLLDNFDTSSKDNLFGYDPNRELKEACEQFDAIIKEAGPIEWTKDKARHVYDVVTDTGSNIITDTGRARRKFEKRFSTKFMGNVISKTKKLVEESSKMLGNLLTIFNKLEGGVSRRNLAVYTTEAENFNKKFKDFHKYYVDYDKEVLTPLRAHQAELNKQRKEKEDEELAIHKAREAELLAQEEEERKVQEAKEYAEVQEARKSPLVEYHAPASVKEEERAPYKEPSLDEWKKKQLPTDKEKLDILNKLEQELDSEDVDFEEESKVAHSNFIDKLIVNAQHDDVSAFVSNLLDYSESLEETDPNASSDLLMVAQDIISDYKIAGLFDIFKGKPTVEKEAPQATKVSPQESQRDTVKKKDKPQELIDERNTLLRPKKLDLKDGRVDKAYTDIPVLSSITPDRIRVTGESGRLLIATFARRLANVLKLDDLEPYIDSIEQNLIPAVRQGVYDGWVVASDSVMDGHNPYDKYIDVYTRINLANIDPSLNGVAKINVGCRVSANHGTVTIRGIKKHFDIDVPKSAIPPKTTQAVEEADDEEDYDDDDRGQHDDYIDQYDTD